MVFDHDDAARRRPRAHTEATELGGISMQEQIMEMKADAAQQEHLVTLVAELMEEEVARNDRLGRSTTLAVFEGKKAPVTAGSYVRRISKYGGCSACCFAVGLIYLKRLQCREASVCLTSCNFQRLFLVAVMLAAKFLDDEYYCNKDWAEVGGISTAELNCLELEFLFRLGFSLDLKREEYDGYVTLLTRQAAGVPALGANADAMEVAAHPVVAVVSFEETTKVDAREAKARMEDARLPAPLTQLALEEAYKQIPEGAELSIRKCIQCWRENTMTPADLVATVKAFASSSPTLRKLFDAAEHGGAGELGQVATTEQMQELSRMEQEVA